MSERPSSLSNEERIELIEAAVDSDAGRAIQGAFLIDLSLAETGVDPEIIGRGTYEAPDYGVGMSEAVLEDLPLERRALLVGAATEALRALCAEAVFQLEFSALRIGADPRTIEQDMVAILASTPIVIKGQRFLKLLGQGGS
jgi:hypothetical protein